MKTTQTEEIIRHMLDSIVDGPLSKDLTDWEMNFIDDINIKFDIYKKLSEKQFEILERIYAEKTI